MKYITLLAALAVSIFLAINIFKIENSITKQKESYANQYDIKSGLFNPTEWKCKFLQIIEKKFDKLNIANISDEILKFIEKIYQDSTESDRKKPLWSSNHSSILSKSIGFIKTATEKGKIAVIDFILDEGKQFLHTKIDKHREQIKKMIESTIRKNAHNIIHSEKESRNFTPICEPKENIKPLILDSKNSLQYLYISFATIFLIFLVSSFFVKGKIVFAIYIAYSLVLLFLGVTLPMIEIIAKIEDMSFYLLGEPINFTNEMLYYRIKSIIDVATVLWNQNPIIAIFITSFSVVFPLFKTLSLIFLIFVKKLNFLEKIVKSIGKWSMADVFVVSIFFSTLSYGSIISDQMSSLKSIDNTQVTINTNHSSFGSGFYIFLAYTIFSIVLSIISLKNEKN
ncbi:paraquat-inducible protein A [bacterium]|nr:paraquat-inducible protein A [bacterium]